MDEKKPRIPYHELEIIFPRDIENFGSIRQPTREGLLFIASLGAETWNSWLFACPQQILDFTNTDFGENPIDFSEFSFGRVIFDGSNFGMAFFGKCDFFGRSSFVNCTFKEDADFSSSRFRESTCFDFTIFKHLDFSNGNFSGRASFKLIEAKESCLFRGAKFEIESDFSESKFKFVDFCHVKFGINSIFQECEFSGIALFRDAKVFNADFSLSRFSNTFDFSCKSDSESKTTNILKFRGCKFESSAEFNNRSFGGKTDFGPFSRNNHNLGRTHFKRAPAFHGCKLHQNTSFDSAEFNPQHTQESARAFRTLKLAMEQLKATQEEQRFFRLEMKAERHSLHWMRKPIAIGYEYCADYGFSLWRPLVALLVFSLIFGGAHGLLANACAEQPQCADSAEPGDSDERTSDLIKYVLVNVAPVPGLDKMQTDLRKPLFGEHGPIAVAAIVLEILHKIVALVMTFLFALGLRNLFKMKS